VTIHELLEEVADDLDDVEAVGVAGGTEWRRGSRPFAAATDDAAEFRLDPLVARAALRTPDTGPATRGIDWVRFAPAELDEPALDRAVAWFTSAWRLAGR
jgi:hypothetical protein